MARPRKNVVAPVSEEVVPEVVETVEAPVLDSRRVMIERLKQLFKEDVLAGYSDDLLRTLQREHLGYE